MPIDPRLQRIADDPKLYLWAAQGIIDFEHLLTRHAEFDAWVDAHPAPTEGQPSATTSTPATKSSAAT